MSTRSWFTLFLALLLAVTVAARALSVDHTHARFDTVLEAFVVDGLVDYASLKERAADSESDFSLYLDELATSDDPDSTWTRDEQLAYWINAYNAFTLKLIVDHYPINARWYVDIFFFLKHWLPSNSILQIPGRWNGKTFQSVRGPITLGAIEHEILRAELDEPRIHFAIVCASIGCPILRSSAFHPDRIEEELNAATKAFIDDPEKVHHEGKVKVSKIFKWFRGDFDATPPVGTLLPASFASQYGKNAGIITWLYAYGDAAIRSRIEDGPYEMGHLGYDWNLNEQ